MSSGHTSLSGFSVITYITKDGEKCKATKNNGIVTIYGDKNGVRQLPLSDFMKEFAENLPKVDLARTPSKDTVQFKGVQEKTVHNPVDKSFSDSKTNNKLRNLAIGIGSLVTAAVILAVASKKGHLPSGAKELFGGVKNDAVKIADDVTGTVKKVNTAVPTEVTAVAAKDSEQIINKKAELLIGKTKAAKKAEDVAAQASLTEATVLPKKKTVQPKVEKQIEQPVKEQNVQNQEIEEAMARLEKDSRESAERLRKQQDEILNEYDNLANIAIADSLMRNTGAKVTEKAANEVVSKDVDKILKQMAKEADKTSETVAKAEIPKSESTMDDITEKLFGEKNELSKAADEFGHYGDDLTHYGDDFGRYGDDLTHYGDNLSHYGDDFGHYGDDLTHYGDDLTNYGDDLSGMDDAFFGF